VLLHVEQCAFTGLLRIHGDHVDGHDVAAQDLGVQPLVGLKLDLAEQGVQVLAAGGQQFAVLGQGGVQRAGGATLGPLYSLATLTGVWTLAWAFKASGVKVAASGCEAAQDVLAPYLKA